VTDTDPGRPNPGADPSPVASHESEEVETSTPSAIHRIVRLSLAQPLLTAIVAVALVAAGI